MGTAVGSEQAFFVLTALAGHTRRRPARRRTGRPNRRTSPTPARPPATRTGQPSPPRTTCRSMPRRWARAPCSASPP